MNIFQYVLDVLSENAGLEYRSPKKILDVNESKAMQDKYEKGKEGVEYFSKIIEMLAYDNDMVGSVHKNVLDGTMRRFRTYFWGELQDESFLDSPESISIFAEIDADTLKAQYRVSLEIDGNRASNDELVKHNSLLDIQSIEGCIYGLNEGAAKKIHYTKDRNEAIEKIKGGLSRKVQLCVIVAPEGKSEKGIIKEMNEAVKKVKKAYNYVTR